MIGPFLSRHARVALTCLAVLVGLLVALGAGTAEARPGLASAVVPLGPASTVVPPSPSVARAKPALRFKLKRLSSTSLQATAKLRAPHRAKCTLTISSGKHAVRLPGVKAVKGKASWGWILSKASKSQTVRLTSTCKRKHHGTTRSHARERVKGARHGKGELVVAGSVSILRGKPIQTSPNGIVAESDGSKGGGDNPGDKGWCTWGAWNLAQWLGTSVYGDAKYWAVRAAANGLYTGTTPVVGSVFVNEFGSYGHVGVVAAVQGNQITITDMNGGDYAPNFQAAGEAPNMGSYGLDQWKRYGSWMTVNFGRYANHTRTINQYSKFIYKPNEAPGQFEGQIVHWAGDTKPQKTAWLVQQGKRYWIPTSAIYYCLKGRGIPGPVVLPANVLNTYPDQTGQWANCTSGGISIGSGAAPTDPGGGPSPPPTWAEQQGSHGANTFTNPYNASGMGPAVAAYAWVDVSCKVYAPQIQSANPDGYWYRIKSAPWNDQYYAVANTFWNGDVPGHLPYTHNTDFDVPNC